MNPVLPPTGSLLNMYPTFNGMVPPEGPKAVPVTCDWSQAHSYDLNSLLTQGSGEMRSIAGLYVDNGANGSQVNIFISQINITYRCAAHRCLLLPIFVPKNAVITFTDASGDSSGKTQFTLCNFPVPALVWDSLTAFS